MKKSYCFDIETSWGSHTHVLEPALDLLEPGALVIEHGAGMYSSALIARFDVRVVCIEEVPGWASWAKWLYSMRGREATILQRAKAAIPMLRDAALVFIDGAPRERGDLLGWALDAGVPTVVAHDTEDGQYGYRVGPRGDYTIGGDGKRPETTMWSKAIPL